MTVAQPIRRLDLLDDFELPAELEARAPSESRGVGRDEVRLMVSAGSGVEHRRFLDLLSILVAEDLLVVNNSKTLPASVALDDVVLNFSTTLPGGLEVVELRRLSGYASQPWGTDSPPLILSLPNGATVELLAPFPVDSPTRRLWVAHVRFGMPRDDYLGRFGGPIRYGHVDAPHPLAAYQTVFGTIPGSAEMPSAARPFTTRLVTALVSSGVTIAPLTLHAGVSSLESGETPTPEWFDVPAATAALVNHTRWRGGRVIAVGTTVTRALESAADEHGRAHPAQGWTELVITPDRPMRAVDGLITGWHEPDSTHLDLLVSLAGRAALAEAYEAALENGYLWHEFGDSHLVVAGDGGSGEAASRTRFQMSPAG